MKNKISILEKLKIFLINFQRDLVNFSYYLIWLLFDPKKFDKINSKEIKNVLVISGGAIGDVYNIIGMINSVIKNYNINLYLLTLKNNKKFIKNPKINLINLEDSKNLVDKKIIDAVILIDPTRQREIFDKELWFKILKVKYIISTDSLKFHPKKIFNQFPIIATRKVYPIRANGPESLLSLFQFLKFKIKKPSFYFTEDGEDFANQLFKKNIKKNEKVVICHVGAGKIIKALTERKTPAHLWPEERWAELIERILKEKNTKVIMTGVKQELIITEKVKSLIKNKEKVISLVGKIPNMEALASIIKRAKATVTIDTSIAHISSQVETPAVILYSSDSPQRVKPISSKNIYIYHKNRAHNCRKYACKYCYELHMKSISVEEVFYSLKKLI
jgi:ADP-heptose:LPS heptosyltransferase